MFQRSLLEEMSKLVFTITKFLYKKILRKRILPKKRMQLCLFLQSSLAIDIKVFLFFFFGAHMERSSTHSASGFFAKIP